MEGERKEGVQDGRVSGIAKERKRKVGKQEEWEGKERYGKEEVEGQDKRERREKYWKVTISVTLLRT